MCSPELEAIVSAFWAERERRRGQPAPSLQQRRAAFDALGRLYPLPGDVTVAQVDAGGVPALWLDSPQARVDQVVLFLHGGCYTMGGRVAHSELAARIGRAARSRILLVEYRLGPEFPYPAALSDAIAAYRWLIAEARSDPPSVALAGDSAGGGLAVAMSLALLDSGLALPAAQVLLSPWLDLNCDSRSWAERLERDPILGESLRQDARDYLSGADPHDPAVSPVFGDVRGLPATMVCVGTEEILFDDSVRFESRARAADVDISLEVGDGLIHGWPFFANTPEARATVARIGRFLNGHLSRVSAQ